MQSQPALYLQCCLVMQSKYITLYDLAVLWHQIVAESTSALSLLCGIQFHTYKLGALYCSVQIRVFNITSGISRSLHWCFNVLHLPRHCLRCPLVVWPVCAWFSAFSLPHGVSLLLYGFFLFSNTSHFCCTYSMM